MQVNNTLTVRVKDTTIRCMSNRKMIRAWGRAILAFDLGIPLDRVRNWERSNSIPKEYWRELLDKAPERNIKISPEMLIDLAARN